MREKIIEYEVKNNDFPKIGIYFVGNRAVVSTRIGNESPKNHIDVYYGLFFWYRIIKAIKECFKIII